MESSHQDLLNGMAEHRPILKYYQKYTVSLFFKINQCLTTSTESSNRDILNDMAEHRLTLKHYQKCSLVRYFSR